MPYGEPLSGARTPLAGFFRILLELIWQILKQYAPPKLDGMIRVSA